jgi:hypothetical protein
MSEVLKLVHLDVRSGLIEAAKFHCSVHGISSYREYMSNILERELATAEEEYLEYLEMVNERASTKK